MGELRQISRLLRPFWRQLLLALWLSTLTVASGIGLMMVSAWLISTAALQLGIVSLGVAPTAVRFFGLSRALFRYLERLVSHDLTFRLLARLRVWFYERLEPLSLTQLQFYRRGDLIARVVSDIEELQNFYLRVISPPLTAIIITALTGFVFSLIDGKTAVVLVMAMAGSGILLPSLTWHWGQKYGPPLINIRRNLHILLLDTVQGLADSIAFGHASRLQQALTMNNGRLAEYERRQGWLLGWQRGLTLLFVNLSATAVLWVAADHVDGRLLAMLTLGTLAAFEVIPPLAEAGQNLGREQTAASRVLQVIAEAPSIPSPPANNKKLSSQPDLVIQDVTFRYQAQETAVLHNFSLTIPYGQHILLIGESGSGKSSLINILLRFAAYEKGSIHLDGQDLRDIPHETLRRTFAVMTQNSYLFNTTISENIRIGRPTANMTDIIAAAKKAQIHAFINKLPQGYETFVGEGGVLLSGGERQRIALARMLLREAPIWILDEVTANLDAVVANDIQLIIQKLAKERTVIRISHQIATIMEGEKIFKLEHGVATGFFLPPIA